MEIEKGIEIIDLALYLEKQQILVIADVHIGYEEALNKQGMMVPRFQFKDILQRLEFIFAELKKKNKQVSRIIINGDLKHEFGTISDQEWRETLQTLDFLEKQCEKIILVRGNHDTVLGKIANKKNIEIVDKLETDGILFAHGDEIKETKAKTIIIGHEHPAVSLKEDVRIEKFKCFIKGKYKGKTLIVQPSFNLVTEGTDISKEDILSPYLKQDLKKFECWIVAAKGKVFYFGKLKDWK